jgi:sialate O-acetylesterase
MKSFGKIVPGLVAGLFLPFLPTFGGDLQLAKVFSGHGVLQCGVPVPVWGTAKPGRKVSVEFAGQMQETPTDCEGFWGLELAPLKVQSTGSQMTISSGEQILQVEDLLVGEVWYASGQSNMQMDLASCAKKLAAIQGIVESAQALPIRTLRVGNPDAEAPLGDLPVGTAWQTDTPENRRKQSAAAYFFARELHLRLQVPVGVIEGSWGGKPIEGFIPAREFPKNPLLKPILEFSDAGEIEKAKHLEGGVIIRNTAGMPGRIFNARVAPVAPYAIRGFLWYQGESNAGNGEDPRNYRHKTRALVEGWRNTWNQPGLPMYYVQLPAFQDSSHGWVRLREEQRLSLDIPNTGMAVTIDLRDPDIHPANKLDVGKRLARWALAKTYGQDIPFSGPLFRSAQMEGNQIRVRFDHAEGGLMIARKDGLDAPVETPIDSPAHFEVNDGSGNWHPAQAKVDGYTIIVTNPSVPNPVAVRYACEGNPEDANLYNRQGLPASPFCSDLSLLPWGDAD